MYPPAATIEQLLAEPPYLLGAVWVTRGPDDAAAVRPVTGSHSALATCPYLRICKRYNHCRASLHPPALTSLLPGWMTLPPAGGVARLPALGPGDLGTSNPPVQSHTALPACCTQARLDAQG